MNEMESECPACGGAYTAKVEGDGFALTFDCDHEKEIFFDAANKLTDAIEKAEENTEEANRMVEELIEEKGVEVSPGRWAIVEDAEERKDLKVRVSLNDAARQIIQDSPEMAQAFTLERKFEPDGDDTIVTRNVGEESVIFVYPKWMDLSPAEQVDVLRREAKNIMMNHVDHCLDCVSSITEEKCGTCQYRKDYDGGLDDF